MKQVKTNAIAQQVKSLTNTEPVKPTIEISQNSKSLLVDYAKNYKGSEKTKNLLVDSLFADGVRSYHIVGATDEDKSLVQFRNQIIQMIVNADPEDAKLYNAEPKTLSLSMQATQTVLKTKTIPTMLGNIKKALARRESNVGKTEKAKPKTTEQMVKFYVQKAIEKLQQSKNGYEGFSKDMESLKAMHVLKQVK